MPLPTDCYFRLSVNCSNIIFTQFRQSKSHNDGYLSMTFRWQSHAVVVSRFIRQQILPGEQKDLKTTSTLLFLQIPQMTPETRRENIISRWGARIPETPIRLNEKNIASMCIFYTAIHFFKLMASKRVRHQMSKTALRRQPASLALTAASAATKRSATPTSCSPMKTNGRPSRSQTGMA